MVRLAQHPTPSSQNRVAGDRGAGASLTMTGCGAANLRRAAAFDPGVTHAKSFVFGVDGGSTPSQRVVGSSADRYRENAEYDRNRSSDGHGV